MPYCERQVRRDHPGKGETEAHRKIICRRLSILLGAMQDEKFQKNPPSDSSWVVVMLAPLSKGQMSPCPFAKNTLSVDETNRSVIRNGTRTDASESDLYILRVNEQVRRMKMERTLAI